MRIRERFFLGLRAFNSTSPHGMVLSVYVVWPSYRREDAKIKTTYFNLGVIQGKIDESINFLASTALVWDKGCYTTVLIY